MLIDDNLQNLAEAIHFVPDMQVADEHLIPEILGDSRFVGKGDRGLTRLKQYKVLEQRRAEEIAAGPDNTEFLRGSGLLVRIEQNIEDNIDRVIELINRTNQLNFTKIRVSEEKIEARREISELFTDATIRCGLVHVKDRFGDYGFCGFYAVHALERRLLHLCFSCRVLGMGVEHWLYDRLGRPELAVRGEVLTDLFDGTVVDWINLDVDGANASQPAAHRFDLAMLRGGCELQVVASFLSMMSRDVVGEFFSVRHNLPVRTDHSILIRYILEGTRPDAIAVLEPLGYTSADFSSRLTASAAADFFVFSFWQDSTHALYRHRETGIEVPFEVPNYDNALNVLAEEPSVIAAKLDGLFAQRAWEYLRSEFDHVGVISPEVLRANVLCLLSRLPADKPVFLLLQKELWHGPSGPVRLHHHIWPNNVLREVAANRKNVVLLRPETFIHDESEAIDGVHFERQVYLRICESIVKRGRYHDDAPTSDRDGDGDPR